MRFSAYPQRPNEVVVCEYLSVNIHSYMCCALCVCVCVCVWVGGCVRACVCVCLFVCFQPLAKYFEHQVNFDNENCWSRVAMA